MSKLKRPLQALLIESDEKVWNSIIDETRQIAIQDRHRDYHEGPCVLCDPEMSFVVQVDITSVRHCTYGTVSLSACKAEGYQNKTEMLKGMRKLYPDADYSEDATIVEWNNARGKFIEEYKRNKEFEKVFQEIEEKSKGTGMEIKF